MKPANPNPNPTMVGVHLFDGDQEVVITSTHDGNGTADDPPGYGYKYLSQVGGGEHWISARALPIRFRAASFDKALEHRRSMNEWRKREVVEAGIDGMRKMVESYGGTFVTDDRNIKWAVRWPNGDVMEFTVTEF